MKRLHIVVLASANECMEKRIDSVFANVVASHRDDRVEKAIREMVI